MTLHSLGISSAPTTAIMKFTNSIDDGQKQWQRRYGNRQTMCIRSILTSNANNKLSLALLWVMSYRAKENWTSVLTRQTFQEETTGNLLARAAGVLSGVLCLSFYKRRVCEGASVSPVLQAIYQRHGYRVALFLWLFLDNESQFNMLPGFF